MGLVVHTNRERLTNKGCYPGDLLGILKYDDNVSFLTALCYFRPDHMY